MQGIAAPKKNDLVHASDDGPIPTLTAVAKHEASAKQGNESQGQETIETSTYSDDGKQASYD
jgi:hypothetical protein